jgi:hypothetical protein
VGKRNANAMAAICRRAPSNIESEKTTTMLTRSRKNPWNAALISSATPKDSMVVRPLAYLVGSFINFCETPEAIE